MSYNKKQRNLAKTQFIDLTAEDEYDEIDTQTGTEERSLEDLLHVQIPDTPARKRVYARRPQAEPDSVTVASPPSPEHSPSFYSSDGESGTPVIVPTADLWGRWSNLDTEEPEEEDLYSSDGEDVRTYGIELPKMLYFPVTDRTAYWSATKQEWVFFNMSGGVPLSWK